MKTYVRRKKEDKMVIEDDSFIRPDSHKQSRSSPLPKPGSEFSVVLSPPSMSNLHDHEEESESSKEKSSTLIESTPDAKIDEKTDLLNLPLAQWVQPQNKRKIVSLETSTQKVISPVKLESVQSLTQSDVDVQRGDVCHTPGCVVWAKKASQMWWPAEVLVHEALAPNSCTENTGGLVLVHYYGSEKSDWVDPARDLSPFEECFEERSRNPSEEFQQALKQALHQKKHQSSTTKLIVPAQGDACLNSTNSNKTEDCSVKGRGKRQRKPKVHFDELSISSNSAKDSRRLRIMRSLGLAPPIGSPFA
ncbi:hypothetical protein ACET3Z_023308 [Daucus carota]